MCLKSNKRLLALVIVSVFAGAAVAAGSSREPSASEDRVPAVGSRASSRSSSARDRPARMGRSERHRTVARVPGLEARVDELGRAVSELSAASSREPSQADASATVDHSGAIRATVDALHAEQASQFEALQRTITDQAETIRNLTARLAALESQPAPTALGARLTTLERRLVRVVGVVQKMNTWQQKSHGQLGAMSSQMQDMSMYSRMDASAMDSALCQRVPAASVVTTRPLSAPPSAGEVISSHPGSAAPSDSAELSDE